MKRFKLKNKEFIIIRKLKKADFNNGFIETLRGINPIPITPKTAKKYFNSIKKKNPNTHIFVALNKENKVIGSASLMIDQKFGGKIGRLEDVVTRKEFRNLGVSLHLQEYIMIKAKEFNCYKLILNCRSSLINFYQKMGFKEDQVVMKFSLK